MAGPKSRRRRQLRLRLRRLGGQQTSIFRPTTGVMMLL